LLSKQFITISGIILIFLILNVSLFGLGSFYGDVMAQQKWGNEALEEGVSYLYSQHITDYPPLYIYVLKFNAWLNLKLSGNTERFTLHYNFISKTIPTFCNLIIGLIIFFYLRKRNYKLALFAGCFYLFNPAIIYNTAYWGQVDSVNTLFMFLSIIFLIHKKYIPSTIFIVLAVLTKFQSIVLVPVIGMVILMNFNIKKIIKIFLTNTIVISIILLPYILGGVFWKVIDTIFGSVDRHPFVTANAYNIWYLISPRIPTNWMEGLNDSFQVLGFSLKFIGLALLGIYTILVLYQLFKKCDKDNIILAAASMAFAFFMLPTQIHDRYLFPFFALFILIVFNNKKYLLIYIFSSITYLFNLMMVLPIIYKNNLILYLIQEFLVILVHKFTFISVAIAIALANIIIFTYFSKVGIFNNLFENLKTDFFNIKSYIFKKNENKEFKT
jgi:Gpi18-like mannosyltransferase